jgi:phosphoribosylaminoimidazole-succinocarboxamide synthase
VRDNYVTGDGRRVLVATDRLSAFDRGAHHHPVPGQVVNQMAQYWFEETAQLAPNTCARHPGSGGDGGARSARRSRSSSSCVPIFTG